MKKFALALSFLLALPLLMFAGYDAMVFRPRMPEIEKWISNASPEDRVLPPAVRQFVEISHGRNSPDSYVASLVLTKLHLDDKGGLGWAVRWALWRYLLKLHLSGEGMETLYGTLAYNGQDSGLNNLSVRLFAKPLSALGPAEAATVVAVIQSPSLYLSDRELLAQRRDLLLSKAHS